MTVYSQSEINIKDKEGNAVPIAVATGGNINPGSKAPIHVDPAIGSVDDPEATIPTGPWSVISFVRGIFKLTKTFDTRMTSITRDKLVMRIGGDEGGSAVLSTSHIAGAVRIHSATGVSYGLTTMGMGTSISAAEPVYLLFVSSIDGVAPPVAPGGMSGLLLNRPINSTLNYRIFHTVLLRGTQPETAVITTDARDQFEEKTVGPEYWGLNGMLMPAGFAMIASSTIEKITPPTNYNFYAQCQITGV